MGTKGFSGTQSILFIIICNGSSMRQVSAVEEDVALSHRHFRTKENKKVVMQ